MTASSLRCDCGAVSEVVQTRPSSDGATRRRRRCPACGQRWTTSEIRAESVGGGHRLAFLPNRKLTAAEAIALVADLIDPKETP